MKWFAEGPSSWRLTFASQINADSRQFAARCARVFSVEKFPGLLEWTLGFTTLLLEFLPSQKPNLKALESFFLRQSTDVLPSPSLIEIPVVYDGPDLAWVAQMVGLTEKQVIDCHSEPIYTIDLLGFAPGFPYLSGLPTRLHLPRRANPRVKVPPGSVAIGGAHAGIYPWASPGGWHLLGSTPRLLCDITLAQNAPEQAFLLRPGGSLRFVPQ
jgi:5-oxoprolinase (ATP-hydrolysing) subunit B